MLTRKTKYAFKALMHIARRNEVISTIELCEKESISRKYLESILYDLKKHGILISKKGNEGGYRLARRPEDITFGMVFRIFEGTIARVGCVSIMAYQKCEECPSEEACEVRKIMKAVRDESARIIDSTTLADMIREEQGDLGRLAAI